METLPASLFTNPVWHSLHTTHAYFAVATGDACRYPAAVAPLAAVANSTAQAMRDLRALLALGESVWLIGDAFPRIPELAFEETLPCLQMAISTDVQLPDPPHETVPLSSANAPEMLALINAFFPGFFRERICEMGTYCGVRSQAGELVAMGGERLKPDGCPEISGICIHPSVRGKGLAASLILHMVRSHRRDGSVSWLHVGTANRPAVELYRKLGFETIREVTFHRVTRLA